MFSSSCDLSHQMASTSDMTRCCCLSGDFRSCHDRRQISLTIERGTTSKSGYEVIGLGALSCQSSLNPRSVPALRGRHKKKKGKNPKPKIDFRSPPVYTPKPNSIGHPPVLPIVGLCAKTSMPANHPTKYIRTYFAVHVPFGQIQQIVNNETLFCHAVCYSNRLHSTQRSETASNQAPTKLKDTSAVSLDEWI